MTLRYLSETATTITFAIDNKPAGLEYLWMIRPDGVITKFSGATARSKTAHIFKKKLSGRYAVRAFGQIAEDSTGVGFASSPQSGTA
jgi:hypothetical protein